MFYLILTLGTLFGAYNFWTLLILAATYTMLNEL